MKHSTTMFEIAKMAGVSKTAVSLVVNNKYLPQRISVKTAERIMAIIQEHGFQPNEFARGFRLKNSKTIGLIVGDVTNPFTALLENSIEQEAKKAGYNLIIASSGNKKDVEKEVIDVLLRRAVKGLIISSSIAECAEPRRSNGNITPIVTIDRAIEGEQTSCIESDNYHSVQKLISLWLKDGKNRLAFIGGDPIIRAHKACLKGFLSAVKKNEIPSSQYQIYSGNFSMESGYESMMKLAGSGFQPDAIFTASLPIFKGALHFLEDNPSFESNKIRFGTFENHPLLDIARIQADAIEQDYVAMGREAFTSLLTMINGGTVETRKRYPARCIIRNEKYEKTESA